MLGKISKNMSPADVGILSLELAGFQDVREAFTPSDTCLQTVAGMMLSWLYNGTDL